MPETVSVLLTGHDYLEQVSCEGPLALVAAQAFAREVNAVGAAAEPSSPPGLPHR
jgi:hypothetical protein